MATVSNPPPIAASADAAEHHRLRGRLGPGSIVFMVVAAAAPLTVIAGSVPIGIAAGNGAGYPAMYVVAAVVLAFFAVGFTAMTRHVPTPAPSTPTSAPASAEGPDWVARWSR